MDGFDSGMSFGNAIVLQAGKGYSLRVVLRSKGGAGESMAASKVTAKITSSATGAILDCF